MWPSACSASRTTTPSCRRPSCASARSSPSRRPCACGTGSCSRRCGTASGCPSRRRCSWPCRRPSGPGSRPCCSPRSSPTARSSGCSTRPTAGCARSSPSSGSSPSRTGPTPVRNTRCSNWPGAPTPPTASGAPRPPSLSPPELRLSTRVSPGRSGGALIDSSAVPHGSDLCTLVLHGLRLKGFASPEQLAECMGLYPSEVRDLLDRLRAEELVTRREGRVSGWALTLAGRRRDAEAIAAELDQAGLREPVSNGYRRFLEVNSMLLEVCTDWQMRTVGGRQVLNDHRDGSY